MRYNKLARNGFRKSNIVRRRLGKRRTTAMVRYRGPSNRMDPGSQTYSAKIDVSLPIYIYSATGPIFAYSFSTSSTVLNSTILGAISLTTNQELIRLANLYAYVKVNGVSISFVRTLNAALNTVYQLPSLHINIMGAMTAGQLTGLTKEDVFQSDGSLELQVLNTIDKPVSKYWGFKEPFFVDGSSAPLGAYMNSANIPTINAIIGYNENPQQSDVTNSPRVGTLDCCIYLTYCKRISLNNL